MNLSRKELVAITEIIVGIICLIVFILLYLVESHPNNWHLQYFKFCSFSVAMICFFFALSTWFCFSNFARARLHTRIFCVTVLWICFLEILSTAFICTFLVLVKDERRDDEDDENNHNYSFNLLIFIACALGFCVAIILLFVNIFLTIIIRRKLRRRRTASLQT